MNNKLLMFFFTIFLNQCSQSHEDVIADFLKNTTEVIEFCNHVLPCIKEEVSKAFTKMPQQKSYLLAKTTLTNCKTEQGKKISSKIHFSSKQVEKFKYEVQDRIKKQLGFENNLSFIEKFSNETQKEILYNYAKCTMIIQTHNNCSSIKETLKKNTFCLAFFKEN